VDLTNPQSLNRYAYVLNNPPTLVDPSGLQSPGAGPCANLPYGRGGGMCQSEVNSVIAGEQSFGEGTWDPFDLMGIDVPDGSAYVSIGSSGTPGQTIGVTTWSFDDEDIISSSIDQTLGVNGVAGVWIPQSLDAFIIFGGDFSGPQGQGQPSGPGQQQAPRPNPPSLPSRVWGCAAQHYGLTGLAAGAGTLGIPIPKTWILGRTAALGGASDTMSLASALEWGLFGSAGPRLAAPLLGTTRLFGVIGRAAPYVSAALFAYDAASIGYCAYESGK